MSGRDLTSAYIKLLKQNFSNFSQDKKESAEVAIECLKSIYSLEDRDIACASRLELSKSDPLTETDRTAEEYKNDGNQNLALKKFDDAIFCYSRAIALDSSNSIYYSNRAAAYSSINKHELAIIDCKESIKLSPKYAKAWSRLGTALSSLSRYDEAIDAYKKSLEIEDNPTTRSSLDTIMAKKSFLNNNENAKSNENQNKINSDTRSNGMEGEGASPLPDLSSLLNNPQLMSMAQNLMKSGALNDMLKDPNMMQKLDALMGGSGKAGSNMNANKNNSNANFPSFNDKIDGNNGNSKGNTNKDAEEI